MIEGQKKLGHKPAIKLHEVLNRSNYSNYCQFSFVVGFSVILLVGIINSQQAIMSPIHL